MALLPYSTLRRRFVITLWQYWPTLILFVLLLPSALPKHATAISEVLPPLPLPAIIFFGLHARARIGYVAVFLAGLIYDVVAALPLGASALLWMLLLHLVSRHRHDVLEEGFLASWVFTAVLLLLILFLQWVLLSYDFGDMLPIGPLIESWIIGLLLFPTVHALLYRIDRTFHRKYWYLLKPA